MDNKFTFSNVNNNTFSGNFDIRHYLNLVQNFKINNFELSAGWRYKSPRPFTPVASIFDNNQNDVGIDYGRFDLSSTYTFTPFKNKSIKAKIAASILNIFNKKNDISRNYRIVLDIESSSYKLREINKFSILRTPNLMFRLDF